MPWKLSLRYYRPSTFLLGRITGMNRLHQSWEPALANFMVTVHAIMRPAKQSLSTLSTIYSYSRIGTFVYCRIYISNVAKFHSAVLLMQPYILLSSIKNFLLGQSFSFSLHTPARLPVLEKWKWNCAIAFLCLITCSFFCEISPNLLQLSSNQYSTSHMIFR